MKIGTLVKAMRGGIGPDELGELFESLGMQCSFTSVDVGAGPFGALALSASAEGAKLVELKGKMRGGESLHALLVLAG